MGNQITYNATDLINNHRIYSGFLQLGIDDGWGTHDKKENFSLMTRIAEYTQRPIKGATILDVGCGTGDLVAYLSDKGIKKYTGIDVFEPSIEKARQKFPLQQFIVGDFLDYNFKKTFDFVFCSGALTTKLASDNYEILKSWLPKMWQLARKGVVFNFLIENGEETADLFLYNPSRVLAICETEIPEATIETVTTSAGMGSKFQEMHVFLY